MDSIGKIYIIRNTVNEKVYIGQTIQSLEDRFKGHLKMAKTCDDVGRKLYLAMNRHGVDRFYIELLEDSVPISILNEREVYYITQFDSYKNGYNSTCGGDGRLFYTDEDIEFIKKMFYSGKTYSQIATAFGVNVMTIQRTLHSLGIRRYKSVTKEYLLNNLEKTNIELAEDMGVSHATITRAFQKFGIPRGKGCNNYKNPQNMSKKEVVSLF